MVSLCHYPYFSLLVSLAYSTVTFRTKWVSFVHITFQQNNCIVFCQLLNNFAARYYLLIGLKNLNRLLWKLLCTDRESLLKRFYRAVIDFAEEITTGCSSLIVVNSSKITWWLSAAIYVPINDRLNHIHNFHYLRCWILTTHLSQRIAYIPIYPSTSLCPFICWYMWIIVTIVTSLNRRFHRKGI